MFNEKWRFGILPLDLLLFILILGLIFGGLVAGCCAVVF